MKSLIQHILETGGYMKGHVMTGPVSAADYAAVDAYKASQGDHEFPIEDLTDDLCEHVDLNTVSGANNKDLHWMIKKWLSMSKATRYSLIMTKKDWNWCEDNEYIEKEELDRVAIGNPLSYTKGARPLDGETSLENSRVLGSSKAMIISCEKYFLAVVKKA